MLGFELLKIREQCNIGQRELADWLGTTRWTIRRAELNVNEEVPEWIARAVLPVAAFFSMIPEGYKLVKVREATKRATTLSQPNVNKASEELKVVNETSRGAKLLKKKVSMAPNTVVDVLEPEWHRPANRVGRPEPDDGTYVK